MVEYPYLMLNQNNSQYNNDRRSFLVDAFSVMILASNHWNVNYYDSHDNSDMT